MSLPSKNPGQTLLSPIKGAGQLARGKFKDALKSHLDPGGVLDVPEMPPPNPPPGLGQVSAQALMARDRVRRQVMGAKGRASTIRTEDTGYTGQQQKLLGS